MKTRSLFSILFVSGLLLCVSVLWSSVKDHAQAQPTRPNGLPVLEIPVRNDPTKYWASDEIIPELNVRQVIIIYFELQKIGVYHVSLSTGAVEFVSLRHIDADFQLRVHNGTYPFPQHIEQNWLNQKN